MHGNSLIALTLWYVFLKDEEVGDDTLPYRNSDPMIGTHTEKVSLKASDSLDSLYSGQSSSSKRSKTFYAWVKRMENNILGPLRIINYIVAGIAQLGEC